MSEFEELIQETKSSLLDLDILLQRTKSLTTLSSERMTPSGDGVDTSVNAIISAIEELSKHLREREALQQTERRNLHLEMKRVRVKIERAIDQLEAGLRCRPEYVCEGAQQQDVSSRSDNARVKMDSLSVDEYLSQGKILLQSNQYEACLKLMTLALAKHPDIEAIHNLARECRRHLEDQQLQEAMVVHLDNLKKEAMGQFDREQFAECVNTFAFLCELEPENQVLRDYLKLSQQQVLETQRVALLDEDSAVQLTAINTMPIREAMATSADSATLSSELPQSCENLGMADRNQREDVEGKVTSQAKSLEETASDREPAKRRSSVLTNWKTLGVAGYLIVLVLMLGTTSF